MNSLFSRVVALAGVVLGVMLMSGCATFTSNQARMSLINVRPASSTVFETAVEITVRLTNETNQPLELTGASHKLELNGAHVGRGVNQFNVTVPPLGTTTVNITLYLENLSLLRKFSDVQNLEQVSYRIDSKLFASGGRSLPVRTEGMFDLRPFVANLQR